MKSHRNKLFICPFFILIRNMLSQNCNSLKSIYVYAEDVPSIDTGTFKGCDSKKCVVYVPKGTYDEYRASKFGYLKIS